MNISFLAAIATVLIYPFLKDLDFLEVAQLVNYLRSSNDHGPLNLSSKSFWADEKYLKPALEGDVLLYALDGVLEELGNSTPDVVQESEDIDPEKKALLARVEALTSQLQVMETKWHNYKAAVDEQLDKRWEDAEPSHIRVRTSSRKGRENGSEDKDYFKGYSYTGNVFISLSFPPLLC